jgi:dienelactone hydrolase
VSSVFLVPPADYLNGANLRAQSQGLVYNSPESAAWIGRGHRFWYRKAVKGGNEFWMVDADALLKRPAFDHEKLASALSLASGQKYTAKTLPFNTLSFMADDTAIEFPAAEANWRCDLIAYACVKIGSATVAEPISQGDASPATPPAGTKAEPWPKVSPDGKLEAFIRDFNLFVRSRANREETQLSWDGTEADYYSWNMEWSPDSSKLAVFRTKPGYKRLVHFIESSPADQLQPKTFSIEYNKPGDDLDINLPVLFHVAAKKQINSRVDLPPVMELHRTSNQKAILEVERSDMQDLIRSGWAAPETFVAKGRDGKTDIWGVLYRPRNLDPSRKYPVIENIYTGPQGSWVPKHFSVYDAMQSLAELGFIVAQVDGMGTNNRSKAFHDVCWKNLGDGGFPDRILWHKAVAAKYSYYDISRVGIYGTSAGGQSAMGALLFYPEFYKVAVSNSGCHDNRLDKLSWNEQWMGYPVGPEYAAASNVENAHKLQGKLLLVAGELDTNVDPSSTLRVVNALVRASKVFDFLYVPGGGHGAGGEYVDHKRNDFFVHSLLGVEPTDWNQIAAKQK